ncbi:PREDICTED: cytochrome P450 27C1-like [Amphimedon queenslandica]|uniref:Cytochrome P450 n=1 Tax=Amphimedon queenslandica TaxID=400682 RepID=A0A1X7U8T8_AMPQE|nr:PREDICTED: cytochrome P450 27C1-like [Amphimedon queenslandica]|eukprot:XP_011405733.1 PREDICTED: cytochrome P450 27C1-like [Amphimedon queenslandica]
MNRFHSFQILKRFSRPLWSANWSVSRCSSSSSPNNEKLLSMSDIPGPRGLPILGSTIDYLRALDKSYLLLFERVKKYGGIYKEKMLAGMPYSVIVTDTSDIETVFRADGKYPIRPDTPMSLDMRDALKIPYGLLLSSNEEWYRQRQSISPFMMVPRKVAEQHIGFNDISDDLVSAIRKVRSSDASVISDVPSLLFKWSFESVSYTTLGKKLGSLNIDNVPKKCQDMIDNTQLLFQKTLEAMFTPPLYKIYPTKLWKDLLRSQKQVYDISMSFVEERVKEIESQSQQVNESDEAPEKMDFLTYMLLSNKLTKEEITSNAVDLMFAGIDTTSYTLTWTLHNLATNIDIQERVREELHSVMGSDNLVTPEHIQKMTILRNCVKESLRLYPTVPMNIRALQQDVVLSGYSVPAGTQVLIPIIVIARMEKYFPNQPNSFIPDRWNREGEYPKNPFAFLPFGFGARMCIGRRVAELELHIAIAKILKNFNVSYATGPDTKMDFVMKLVIVPEKQLDLVFSDI